MDLHLDLKAPWVPDIGVRFVPKAEKQAAEAFYHNLYELQKWSDDFASSLALYDFARSQPHGDFGPANLMRRWSMMAARNGGLALRNFCQCLAAARGVVGKVSFWAGKIDLKALKSIEAEFRDRFPDIDKLRHAVAHPVGPHPRPKTSRGALLCPAVYPLAATKAATAANRVSRRSATADGVWDRNVGRPSEPPP